VAKEMTETVEKMKKNARGFVFIKTKPGKEQQVADKLLRLEEVKEAHIMAGEWDVLAVLEVRREIFYPLQRKILGFVMDKVAKLPSVVDTNTIVPGFSRVKRKRAHSPQSSW